MRAAWLSLLLLASCAPAAVAPDPEAEASAATALAPAERARTADAATSDPSAGPVQANATAVAPTPLASSMPSVGTPSGVVCRQDARPASGARSNERRFQLVRMPPEMIHRPIAARNECFRRCYQLGLVTSPNLSGRVSVKFIIQKGTGLVRSVENVGSTLADGTVVACVLDEVKGLLFPAPDNDITVTYPLMFAP